VNNQWMLAAHLRHEHGWSWARLVEAFGDKRVIPLREVRHGIEYAADRMGYTTEENL